MAQLLNSSLAGVVTLLIYYFWTQVRRRNIARQLGCSSPPTYPHKDPIFGLDLLFKTIKLLKQRQAVKAATERYKNLGSTYQQNTLGYTVLNTIDPENIRVTYTDQQKWGVEDFRLPPMEPFCGRGFITTDGATWKRSRALLQPAFAKANVSDMSHFDNALEDALSRLPSDESTVDLVPFLNDLFLETATDFTLGISLNRASEDTKDCPIDPKTFLEAFYGAEAGMGIRFLLGRLSIFLPKKKWMEMIAVSHQFIDYYVSKGLEKASKQGTIGTDKRTLLQSVIGQTRNKEEIRVQIMQGIMAAQDTTSILLANTFFLLSRSPDIWERFRAEVLDMADKQLTFDSLKSLKFLKKILNESLRIYPVFNNMGRISLEDTTLPKGGGPDGNSPIFVAANTRIINSFYALHRNPAVFGDDVEVFRPDRWDTIKPDTWEYLPFAAGPRGCVGQPKALAEASLVLVKMAQRFRQIESRDDREWVELVKLTLGNANGCKVGLIPVDMEQ